MNFKLSQQNSASCFFLEYEQENRNDETLLIELCKCTNPHTKNGLPTLWKKNGYTETKLETWWSLRTYVTDTDGNCWGKYNPQHINYQRFKKGKRVESRNIINFDWMMEATQENGEKLLKECERMFLNCEQTKREFVYE